MRFGSTRWPILAVIVVSCALGLSFSAQTLVTHWNGDRLQVTAPGLHFLTGKALDRLRNGASVPYAFQMTLTSIPRTLLLQRTFDRFIVSYDVWGETFAVVQTREDRKAISHLAAAAAEAWCVARISVPSAGVPLDKDLWLRLEVRAEEPVSSPITDSGLSLTSLIEIFSRPPRFQTQEWNSETAPFRLASLKREELKP